MPTNFPNSVDVLTNPAAGDSQNSPSHAAQHADANDAIEAIETYVLNQQPSFRNAIINGDFRIWQRGTSPTSTSGSYLADRWLTAFDGSGSTRAVTAQTFTLGSEATVGYEAPYFLRYAQSVAGTSATYTWLSQRIESVRKFAGQTVTVSFWAKAAANTTMPSVVLRQAFGTGGSPSSVVDTTVTSNVAITTTWQRFTYSIAIPAITGKTLGSNNNDYLELAFSLPINTTYTLDFWGVQVEAGSVATPFEQRPIGTELALCQRYFYKIDDVPDVFGISFSSTVGVFYQVFPVTMRVVPTPTYPSTGLTNAVDEFGVGVRTPTSLIASGINTNSDNFQCTGMSGVTAGRPLRYVGPAITYSAEL